MLLLAFLAPVFAAGSPPRPSLLAPVQPPAPACAPGIWVGDHMKAPSSNFGCATDANLAAMVANPADLAVGRAESAAPADRSALAVERLRKGEAKGLPSDPGAGEASLIVRDERKPQ